MFFKDSRLAMRGGTLYAKIDHEVKDVQGCCAPRAVVVFDRNQNWPPGGMAMVRRTAQTVKSCRYQTARV